MFTERPKRPPDLTIPTSLVHISCSFQHIASKPQQTYTNFSQGGPRNTCTFSQIRKSIFFCILTADIFMLQSAVVTLLFCKNTLCVGQSSCRSIFSSPSSPPSSLQFSPSPSPFSTALSAETCGASDHSVGVGNPSASLLGIQPVQTLHDQVSSQVLDRTRSNPHQQKQQKTTIPHVPQRRPQFCLFNIDSNTADCLITPARLESRSEATKNLEEEIHHRTQPVTPRWRAIWAIFFGSTSDPPWGV